MPKHVEPWPALSLANTRTGPGDRLSTPAHLGRWLEEQRGTLGDPGGETALRLPEFRALREAVRELLEAAVSARPLSSPAVAAVNSFSTAVPLTARLVVGEDGRVVAEAVPGHGSPTGVILAAISRSAIELLGGEGAGRLGVCSAARCGRFFLAARAGQRWCSNACGNRERVARHRTRA